MITVEQIQNALREVYDPEIEINVQDLGLIYDIKIQDSDVTVTHSLTSVMCPFADQICADIESAVQAVPGVDTVNRILTFNPPFSMEMVPEETRMIMGWF
jgi:metal-sulfur cluster biosynthetic enzyme